MIDDMSDEAGCLLLRSLQSLHDRDIVRMKPLVTKVDGPAFHVAASLTDLQNKYVFSWPMQKCPKSCPCADDSKEAPCVGTHCI